jgi:hypothetical protein
MKTDLYTKSILTVIAACLLSIVFRGTPLISTAHAQEPTIVPTAVNIVQVAGNNINPPRIGELPVTIEK